MAQRTPAELRSIILNNIKPNANNEITGQISQDLFIDFIDSFTFGNVITGLIDFSQQSSNITPVGTSLTIPLLNDVKSDVTIEVNGVNYKLGVSDSSAFFVKDITGTTVRTLGTIVTGDILHYNAAALEFTIDTEDVIVLRYLVEVS